MRKFAFCLAMFLGLAGPALAALSLSVTCDHEAKVYLGGKYLGKTPLDLSSVKVGTHTLKVESTETGEVKTYTVTSSHRVSAEKSIEVAFGPVSGSRLEPSVRDASGRRAYATRGEEGAAESRPYVESQRAPEPACRCCCYQPAYGGGLGAVPTSGYYAAPYAAPYATAYAAQPVAVAPQYYSAQPVYASPAYGYSDPYYGGNTYGSPGYRRGSSSNNFRNVLLGAGLVNEVFNRGSHSRNDIRRGVVGAALLNELVRGSRGSRSSGLGGLFGY